MEKIYLWYYMSLARWPLVKPWACRLWLTPIEICYQRFQWIILLGLRWNTLHDHYNYAVKASCLLSVFGGKKAGLVLRLSLRNAQRNRGRGKWEVRDRERERATWGRGTARNFPRSPTCTNLVYTYDKYTSASQRCYLSRCPLVCTAWVTIIKLSDLELDSCSVKVASHGVIHTEL